MNVRTECIQASVICSRRGLDRLFEQTTLWAEMERTAPLLSLLLVRFSEEIVSFVVGLSGKVTRRQPNEKFFYFV